MRKLLKKLLKKFDKWKFKRDFNNCFDLNNIYKFYYKEAKIVFSKSQNIKIHLEGTDLNDQTKIYDREINLQEDYTFHFQVDKGHRIHFILTVFNEKNKYRKYQFFICNKNMQNLPANYISHAMGRIENLLYTNSMEAFISNYEKGFRIFEVDLQLTQDNKVILFHDLKDYQGNRWIEKDINFLTLDEILSFKYINKFSILTLSDLIDLLNKYDDVYFILDIKTSKKNIKYINRLYNFYLRQIKHVEDNYIYFIKKHMIKNQNILDETIIKKIIIATNNNTKLLNRLIPQVHIENIEIIYKYYDFPLKIWRDNHDTVCNDLTYLELNCISNYSINFQKYKNIKILQKNIKYYFYNFANLDELMNIDEVGYFTDGDIG